MKSLQGHLLIATAELLDPNFFQSVVLLVQHSEEGALGVILNRPSKTTIRRAWEEVRSTPCAHDVPLHLGGPCQGPLMAVHREASLSEAEVAPEAFFSADPESLEQLVASPEIQIKFFIGYAGWGAGQLEQELALGSWEVLPAHAKHLFGSPASLWEESHREVAGRRLFSAMRIKHVPDDPRLN